MRYFAGPLLRATTGSATTKAVSLAKTPQFGVFFYGKNKSGLNTHRKYLHGQHTNHNCRSRHDQKYH
jgi:hypothetical protein